jgi:hypothetical protein
MQSVVVRGGADACPDDDIGPLMGRDADGGLEAWLAVLAEPADGVKDFTGVPPGGWLADVIAEQSLDRLSDESVLSSVVALEKVASWVAAQQARAIREFAGRRDADADDELVDEFAGDELATALTLSPRTAARRLEWAMELTGRLAKTHAALTTGQVTYAKARVIAEETAHVSDEVAAQVEDRVLPDAPDKTPGELRRAVKRAVLAIDTATAAERAEIARADRRVSVTPLSDGMAEFRAILPAPDAIGLYTRLTDMARTARTTGDARTLDQIRADALADLVRDTAGPAARPLVRIVLTDTTLVGGDDGPAELTGYGPISAPVARNIAADGIWQALRTDSAGTLAAVGRHRYRPSPALAEFIRGRDHTCRFPGCAQPAYRCDIDHTTRFPVGETEPGNLACLCRHHHRLKTRGEHQDGGWSVHQTERGALVWTSPTNGTHITGPHRYPSSGPPPDMTNSDPPPF